VAVVASIQLLALTPKQSTTGEPTYTKYNNYVIFKQSYHHLITGKDLYILYPQEQFDLYKYSPTFALFFGFFAHLPDWAGLILWNLLNTLVLLLSIYYLPKLTVRQKAFISLFCLIELLTSLQNSQSNALMAGLLIFAFGLMEKQKWLWAALCIILSAYIKIFGIVAFALYLFYLGRWKLSLYSAFWTVLLLILPLLVINTTQLQFLWVSWKGLLQSDHDASYGLSVMGWLYTWFGINANKMAVLLAGAALFCIPLLRFKKYKQFQFRALYLASVLVWIVIFNHKAESPTFIIAIAGVAIWYFSQPRTIVNTILMWLAFILTSLSPTDLMPHYLQDNWIDTYVLKAIPCIIIWAKISWDLWTCKPVEQEVQLV